MPGSFPIKELRARPRQRTHNHSFQSFCYHFSVRLGENNSKYVVNNGCTQVICPCKKLSNGVLDVPCMVNLHCWWPCFKGENCYSTLRVLKSWCLLSSLFDQMMLVQHHFGFLSECSATFFSDILMQSDFYKPSGVTFEGQLT